MRRFDNAMLLLCFFFFIIDFDFFLRDDEIYIWNKISTLLNKDDFAGHAAAVSNMEQIQEDRDEKSTVHTVRNLVEKIVEGLIDSVDDTPIDRLYNDSACKYFIIS